MALTMALGRQSPVGLGMADKRVRSTADSRTTSMSLGSFKRWSGDNTLTLRALSPRLVMPGGLSVRASRSGVETSERASSPAGSKEIIPDNEVSITRTSFGTIGLTVGIFLLSYGFGSYFTVLPGTEISALLLTYGFPLTIIGMALKYAELKPVPCLTYADAYALRESQATEILTQVRNDVTRFRYGDEQHLDEALKRIFRYGQAGGIQRRNAPKLKSIREEVTGDKQYTLVLEFESPNLKIDEFNQRLAKFTSFFGPGVTAEISAGSGPSVVDVALVANGPKAAASP